MGFYDAMHADAGTLKLFIGGEWRASESGKTVSIANPSREGEIACKVQGERVQGDTVNLHTRWDGASD